MRWKIHETWKILHDFSHKIQGISFLEMGFVFFSKFHVKVDLGIPGLSGLFPQTLKLVLRDLVGCRGLWDQQFPWLLDGTCET